MSASKARRPQVSVLADVRNHHHHGNGLCRQAIKWSQ